MSVAMDLVDLWILGEILVKEGDYALATLTMIKTSISTTWGIFDAIICAALMVDMRLIDQPRIATEKATWATGFVWSEIR